MYKFNPEHIAALSSGKAICQHTKKEEDLPLLRAIFKQAFPKETYLTGGSTDYFYTSLFYLNGWGTSKEILPKLQHLPIIPLHDFLAKDELPKEDLNRIDLMDKRLKELEGLVKGEHKSLKNDWLVNAGYFGINLIYNSDKVKIDHTETADLIRWVLDNQEQVIKLKNQ
jgi:hypothetical protein